jgi:hypothetical protein
MRTSPNRDLYCDLSVTLPSPQEDGIVYKSSVSYESVKPARSLLR